MKVIFINGPMGVGKTTVGRIIAEKNPGTALIDGDWCMDLHPFVGNRETRAMAVDNILHMIFNYRNCSVCRMVVVPWLMDDPWVCRALREGLAAPETEAVFFTLVCSRDQLVQRWKLDRGCAWRTDDWLEASLKSLPYFASLDDTVDTDGLTAEAAADRIMRALAPGNDKEA